MKLYLISDDPDTYVGLRMTGIDGTVLHDEAGLAPALAAALADPTIAALLISERLAQRAQTQLLPYKMSLAAPLVLELPDRHRSKTEEQESVLEVLA
jgi:Archaeal/vacuolar-type H+-ATPase subunit F